MVDYASLAWDLAKDGVAIVTRGLEYNGTRESLEATVNDLSPVVERIEDSLTRLDLPIQLKHVQKLKKLLAKNAEAIGKHKIHWWNCVLAPWYQQKLEKEAADLERFASAQTQIHMFHLLTKILSVLSSKGPPSLGRRTNYAYRFADPLDERFPKFTVGLDGDSMQELRKNLLTGKEQVINLYGMPGSGKTTMAQKLCRDPQVQGKFKKNIFFETLGSQIEVEEAVKKLRDHELPKYGENPVLLVLDDVWPRTEDIVEMMSLKHKDSRILVTSRTEMKAAGSRHLMKLLSDKDAEKLLRHFLQSGDIDFDDQATSEILLQVLEGCKGLPLAIEFIGRKLRRKGSVQAVREVQLEWSRGHSILDSHEDLLTRLQNSVDESHRDYFMDLGLFPEDQKIPITVLIDMWIELHHPNEPASLPAMAITQELVAMNLAADIKVRRIVGREDLDDYYNNYFLEQHDLFRELAIHMSKQEPLENRERLIIDMFGSQNHPPEWWPKQQQSVVAPKILSISTDQNITPHWCSIQAAKTVVLVLNIFKTAEYTLPEFIKEMENLKVLIVTNNGACKTDLRNLELLGSLLSLKRIRLQQVSIPSLRDLKNVHKLSLYMCDVKKAFENSSIDFSEAMPKLVELSIEYCKDLVELPTGFCKMVTMKNLTISSCHDFVRLHEEIGKLENLELLRINYCANFEEMPESISELQSLTSLDISYCPSLRKLPVNIG
ncbi:probable disease resistance protein At5g66900 isoform X2 [Neltuma alba]|uniref:probable disease resistance protein At5g66900 isoform X2 n=2 Tax=Neltuma alba TaxID=207710 RepID=UPI0010A2ACC0|nr:probable disease resistance protein At5g66900 isoform X2 [Prosopis alba]